MKTWGVVVGLTVLLLALVGPWTVGPAATQTRTLRGWAIVDFKGDPRAGLRKLWDDANFLKPARERWTGKDLEGNPCSPTRPNAAVLSVSRVVAIGTPDTRQRWEGFVLISAASEPDLILVETYIEKCFTHVDLYRIDEGQ